MTLLFLSRQEQIQLLVQQLQIKIQKCFIQPRFENKNTLTGIVYEKLLLNKIFVI